MSHKATYDLSALLIGGPKQIPTFPVIQHSQHEYTRVQIIIGEGRHALLIRHIFSYHWCGYVILREAEWKRIAKTARTVARKRITYVGEPTKYITWMGANTEGRMVNPVQVFPEGDYFVGYDRFQLPDISQGAAMQELLEFEIAIHKLLGTDLLL